MKEFAYNEDEIASQSKILHLKARFLIDECLGIEIARQLKELKYKSVYVDDVGLTGKSDDSVFAYANKHNLILLTHDMDFWDDRNFQ